MMSQLIHSDGIAAQSYQHQYWEVASDRLQKSPQEYLLPRGTHKILSS